MHRADGSHEDRAFLVMCGVGLDAEMMTATDPRAKRRLGWLGYVTGAARTVATSTRFQATLTADDGEPHRVRTHNVLIGNCGVLPGKIVLMPEAQPDDGQLDVLALSPKSVLDWLRVGQRVFIEHPIDRTLTSLSQNPRRKERPLRQLTYLHGERTRVLLRGVQQCELDGDPFGDVVALSARVSPLALTVKVPQPGTVQTPLSLPLPA